MSEVGVGGMGGESGSSAGERIGVKGKSDKRGVKVEGVGETGRLDFEKIGRDFERENGG